MAKNGKLSRAARSAKSDDDWQAGAPGKSAKRGTIQGHAGRGYFVPNGFTVGDVVAVARVFEEHFGVAAFLSVQMAGMALSAVSPAQEGCSETDTVRRRAGPSLELWPQGSGLRAYEQRG